jgi:hypothetical protein
MCARCRTVNGTFRVVWKQGRGRSRSSRAQSSIFSIRGTTRDQHEYLSVSRWATSAGRAGNGRKFGGRSAEPHYCRRQARHEPGHLCLCSPDRMDLSAGLGHSCTPGPKTFAAAGGRSSDTPTGIGYPSTGPEEHQGAREVHIHDPEPSQRHAGSRDPSGLASARNARFVCARSNQQDSACGLVVWARVLEADSAAGRQAGESD